MLYLKSIFAAQWLNLSPKNSHAPRTYLKTDFPTLRRNNIERLYVVLPIGY
jgi:hypothetical protein